MSQTCTVCLAECLNPYTYFCPRNFSTTKCEFCRVYLCSACAADRNFLRNGCPNCHNKGGRGKFVPPGHTDEILSARAPVQTNPQVLPLEVPDFSEEPAILTTKRRPVPT